MGLSPRQIVDELTKLAPDRWGFMSSAALAAASVRHKDPAFAEAIIERAHPLGGDLDDLWALIPVSAKAPLAKTVMTAKLQYDNGDALGAALRAVRGRWTPALRDIAAMEMITSVDKLPGRERWASLARLRALVTAVPIDLLPAVVDRVAATDADSRDIIDIAESRRRFATIVAESTRLT